jgi:hypothetical protein
VEDAICLKRLMPEELTTAIVKMGPSGCQQEQFAKLVRESEDQQL